MTNLPVQEALSTLRMLDETPTRQRLSEPVEDFRTVLARSLPSESPHEASDSRRSEFLASEPREGASDLRRAQFLASDSRSERDRAAKSDSRREGDPRAVETSASSSRSHFGAANPRRVDAETADDRGRPTDGAHDHGRATGKDSPAGAERSAGGRDGREAHGAAGSETKPSDARSTAEGKKKALAAEHAPAHRATADAPAAGAQAAASLAGEAAKAATDAADGEAKTVRHKSKASELAAKIGAERVVEGMKGKEPSVGPAEASHSKGNPRAGAKAAAAEAPVVQALAAELLAQLSAKAAAGATASVPSKGERAEATPAKADGFPGALAPSTPQGPPHLTIIDLRGAAHHNPVEQASDSGTQAAPTPTNQHTVEVRLYGLATGNGGPSGAQTGGSALFKMDSMFAFSRQEAMNDLQQSWGPLMNQIMKSTGIVLKDNSSGEIRLLLKPEHLGSVRIQLEMKDNLISGKIVVENQSVRQLFQQNLEALYRAFQESGFNTATLNVSVNGNGSGGREKGRYSALPAFGAVAGAQGFVDHIPDLRVDALSDSMINLVV